MAKRIISVGFEVPGGEVEEVPLLSRRSLLDADIIVFSPKIPDVYAPETYQGKPCLSDDSSFQCREAIAHWRRELIAAIDAGKLVVVLLQPPEIVYAATGDKQYSGTGRNMRTTRIVDQLHAYQVIPTKWQYHTASGSEMSLVPEARFFASYWAKFAEYSRYEVYLEGEMKETLIKTKTGNRIVGACIRKGHGALLAIPSLALDKETFSETRKVEGKNEYYWTKDAIVFGRQFTTVLVALADSLASEVAITPPPDWMQDDAYHLPEEAVIEIRIGKITAQIAELEEKRRELESQLETAGTLRNLLFEQGKPLEHAVLQALGLFGFNAKGFKDNGSEFDAVFISPEGRFIGEIEGKDNKAINIDKFSQLERNLNEDFARKGVDQFAKGVLFGNPFRLSPLDSREKPFTEKCQTAATRLGVALVNTSDLFAPCRYLKSNKDADYAKKCREAIFKAVGDVVIFPTPPISNDSDKHVEAVVSKSLEDK